MLSTAEIIFGGDESAVDFFESVKQIIEEAKESEEQYI
jgi:hypothetical protein